MCDKVFSKKPKMLKSPYRYKTREICNKAVDNFLPTLKFVPDWFLRNKVNKEFYNALFWEDDILFL